MAISWALTNQNWWIPPGTQQYHIYVYMNNIFSFSSSQCDVLVDKGVENVWRDDWGCVVAFKRVREKKFTRV